MVLTAFLMKLQVLWLSHRVDRWIFVEVWKERSACLLRVKQPKKSGLGLLHSEDGDIMLNRHVSAVHVVFYLLFSVHVCKYKMVAM